MDYRLLFPKKINSLLFRNLHVQNLVFELLHIILDTLYKNMQVFTILHTVFLVFYSETYVQYAILHIISNFRHGLFNMEYVHLFH